MAVGEGRRKEPGGCITEDEFNPFIPNCAQMESYFRPQEVPAQWQRLLLTLASTNPTLREPTLSFPPNPRCS